MMPPHKPPNQGQQRPGPGQVPPNTFGHATPGPSNGKASIPGHGGPPQQGIHLPLGMSGSGPPGSGRGAFAAASSIQGPKGGGGAKPRNPPVGFARPPAQPPVVQGPPIPPTSQMAAATSRSKPPFDAVSQKQGVFAIANARAGGYERAKPQGGAPTGAPQRQQGRMQPAASGRLPLAHPAGGLAPSNQQPQQQGQAAPAPAHPPQQGGASGPRQQEGPSGGMRELRVEDALIYLDDVKREFGDRPRIYNEFLEIMKNFKTQEVDTPGVIHRVSNLFRGYNKLILGFNKFLPDGYKISIEDLERQEAKFRQQAMAEGRSEHTGFGARQPPVAAPNLQPNASRAEGQGTQAHGVATHNRSSPSQNQPVIQAKLPQLPTQQNKNRFQQSGGPQGMQQHAQDQSSGPGQEQQQKGASQQVRARQQGTPPQNVQQPAQPMHQAVEFDHAISYVTNIKKRFADDPGTYHKFLEILHTYQKEQRGIKEVLEQVAALFADHPDLLKEFTFFLPDAVQEQAKERLHRAAAESESRMAAQRQMQEQGSYNNNRQGQNWGPRALDRSTGRRVGGGGGGGQKFIDMTENKQAESQEDDNIPSPGSRKRPFSPGRESVMIQPPQPETFVYNSAVERQFFEAAKEALTAYSRDGGQAWAEFLKCLDMYAQELLSKNEMLSFVEPLLGKRNSELFEEFKRILAAAGSHTGPHPSMEDSWYSVPLSEIDFFRCRQCSPSYRALPRDYPAPPCSGRSDDERKVLNDVWVSLPKGSEESYTFRHMRRNQHEETLFRVEDERFEIDMVIDSNAATLRRLEPIAEEIAFLSQEESLVSEIGSKPPTGDVGMGGVRYQYTFDPKILGTIHRNSIARIYGDAGQEMLELIVKNPSVAVPIVVHRLRQKDKEWKAARERLNRNWKESAEMNYYKSLDHRSLTWRTTDKRATSTRTLLTEIKDRSANCGKESEQSLLARREKAKEEHGAFYEITKAETLSRNIDLTGLPKGDLSIFTPHLSLIYENNSWAQRDAYRILCFALERGTTSPTDKERCHSLWRDFFGRIFGLSYEWVQRPAVAFQESTAPPPQGEQSSTAASANMDDGDFAEDDSSTVEEPDLDKNVVMEEVQDRSKPDNTNMMDHHPLPAGSIVSTVYGEGKLIRFRRANMTYEVELDFGTAFLGTKSVLSSIPLVERSAYTTHFCKEDTSRLERADDMLCIGTQALYLFFRLHQILVHRLNVARQMAFRVSKDPSLATLVEQMSCTSDEDLGRKRYEGFLSLVYALLEGCHSNDAGGKYEDRVRCLLGHGAYELATMDKLVSHIQKNMQAMANDDVMLNLVSLFGRHLEQGFRPDAFRQEAAMLSEGEVMYAFQLCSMPETDRKILHIELLGVICEDDDQSQAEQEEEPLAKRARYSRV